jgi:hypothetical protein
MEHLVSLNSLFIVSALTPLRMAIAKSWIKQKGATNSSWQRLFDSLILLFVFLQTGFFQAFAPGG